MNVEATGERRWQQHERGSNRGKKKVARTRKWKQQ